MSPDAVRDRRITDVQPMISPTTLRENLPLVERAESQVIAHRRAVADAIRGDGDCLLVVVGPCSIHDPEAALDYARRLTDATVTLADALHVVMRVYFEKPRTTLGWKGLINDPGLDGTYRVNDGLTAARRLVLAILELGLPVGCEFLDPITPQYLADAVSWGSIGARTAQSQIHRQLASGLSMPIGIKNSTEGDIQAAIDAVAAAAAPHVFPGIDDDGRAAVFTTSGNPDCHIVLRGGSTGPNYDPDSIREATKRLEAAGLPGRLLVDASHGNSRKDHRRQLGVVEDLAQQMAGGESAIAGVMLESFLGEGRQELTLGQAGQLAYGVSVTDACMGWETTFEALCTLAAAVRSRREGGRPRRQAATEKANVGSR